MIGFFVKEIEVMERVFNFSAGPSMLPEEVLRRAAEETVCYQDSGMSVMEMSHRSPVYEKIISDAEHLFREVMEIPDNYRCCFYRAARLRSLPPYL